VLTASDLVDAMDRSAVATAETKRADQLARRRAKEAEARAAKRAAKNGNGKACAGGTEAEKFWRHAETLAPGKPWRAIVREFGTNEAVAVDAHRNKTVPPGIVDTAIKRFLELPAT
jgi:hypothetical protein